MMPSSTYSYQEATHMPDTISSAGQNRMATSSRPIPRKIVSHHPANIARGIASQRRTVIISCALTFNHSQHCYLSWRRPVERAKESIACLGSGLVIRRKREQVADLRVEEI